MRGCVRFHEGVQRFGSEAQTGEVFRNDTRLKVVVLEVMTLMADTDAGSKVVCGWLKHEEPELREGLLSFLCDCVEDWECTAGATPPRWVALPLGRVQQDATCCCLFVDTHSGPWAAAASTWRKL